MDACQPGLPIDNVFEAYAKVADDKGPGYTEIGLTPVDSVWVLRFRLHRQTI